MIKLFVCCHTPCYVPPHSLLFPLQVGAALCPESFPGFLRDDTGENISARNRSYCELTGQYWAWKNVKADYYGFFHYRRYLYPDPKATRPYRIEAEPTEGLLRSLGYDSFAWEIEKYDMILPRAEDMHIRVRDHYAKAPHHRGKDLDTAVSVLKEQHPQYTKAAEKYLMGTKCYFGNIFIMRKEVFHDYCAWLYPLLEEFDRRTDTSGYDEAERRVDGYIGERLLGIYATEHAGDLRIGELPGVHFYPGRAERIERKVLNAVLPPGTARRAAVKSRKKAG